MERAREEILAAGVEILLQHGPLTGWSALRVRDAARRASYTSGAAYRYWPVQDEFRADVVAAVIARRTGSAVSETVGGIRALVGAGASFDEIIQAGCRANLHDFSTETDYLTTLALRLAASSDDRLRSTSRERFHKGLNEYVELYVAMLRLSGRRVRAPLNVEHIALIFAALGEGFAMQAALGVDHPSVGGPVEEMPEWPLLAVVVRSLVDALTEPSRSRAD